MEYTIKNAFNGSWLVLGALLLALAGCAGSGQKSGEYVDDSWITTKVKSELVANKHVDAHHINVKTSGGVVTLSGTASSWTEANKAAEIAHGVKGVNRVQNDITY